MTPRRSEYLRGSRTLKRGSGPASSALVRVADGEEAGRHARCDLRALRDLAAHAEHRRRIARRVVLGLVDRDREQPDPAPRVAVLRGFERAFRVADRRITRNPSGYTR